MQVRFVGCTSGVDSEGKILNAEEMIVYAARVSNPTNQLNHESASRLIAYLLKHGHYSPFEVSSLTLEIETSRAIATQILRHRSFTFQEFSQRYAEATEMELYEARRQDVKNRQNSINDLSNDDRVWFNQAQQHVWTVSNTLYREALQRGIAKESARFLLPLNTQTKLYVTGPVRSWIHYLQSRDKEGVQLEHRNIAIAAKEIFVEHFPATSEALEWVKNETV